VLCVCEGRVCGGLCRRLGGVVVSQLVSFKLHGPAWAWARVGEMKGGHSKGRHCFFDHRPLGVVCVVSDPACVPLHCETGATVQTSNII
jgi:hypothetical protein